MEQNDRNKVNDSEKQPRRPAIKRMPRPRIININLKTVGYFLLGLLVLFFFVNLFNKGSDGLEISVSDFVTNAKANNYSSVDIRDDGKAVATSKIYVVTNTTKSLNIAAKTNLSVYGTSDLQSISLNDLYGLIKPLTFGDTIKLITQPQLFPRTNDIYITDNYIVARSIIPRQKILL